jgi:hypothetical protein
MPMGSASSPADLFGSALSQAGAYSPYINICGNDDPSSPLGSTVPADLQRIKDNWTKAMNDVSLQQICSLDVFSDNLAVDICESNAWVSV